jgi:hypothetical protein
MAAAVPSPRHPRMTLPMQHLPNAGRRRRYIAAELLAHTHLAVDGSLILRSGYAYKEPHITAAALRQQVDM